MNIQIIGTKGSVDTRKAVRFFKERNVPFHFRDLSEKGVSPGELRGITASVPAEKLIDPESKAYKKRGMQYLEYDAAEEILEDPLLLTMPIVRNGSQATVGYDIRTWEQWIQEG